MNPQDELQSLFPNLSPDQLREAKDNLDAYLMLAWEIMEEAEPGRAG